MRVPAISQELMIFHEYIERYIKFTQPGGANTKKSTKNEFTTYFEHIDTPKRIIYIALSVYNNIGYLKILLNLGGANSSY